MPIRERNHNPLPRIKDAAIRIPRSAKDAAKNMNQSAENIQERRYDNAEQYAEKQMENAAQDVAQRGSGTVKSVGDGAIRRGRDAVRRSLNEEARRYSEKTAQPDARAQADTGSRADVGSATDINAQAEVFVSSKQNSTDYYETHARSGSENSSSPATNSDTMYSQYVQHNPTPARPRVDKPASSSSQGAQAEQQAWNTYRTAQAAQANVRTTQHTQDVQQTAHAHRDALRATRTAPSSTARARWALGGPQ